MVAAPEIVRRGVRYGGMNVERVIAWHVAPESSDARCTEEWQEGGGRVNRCTRKLIVIASEVVNRVTYSFRVEIGHGALRGWKRTSVEVRPAPTKAASQRVWAACDSIVREAASTWAAHEGEARKAERDRLDGEIQSADRARSLAYARLSRFEAAGNYDNAE